MITLSDPIKNTALQNLLKSQTSLNVTAGATIEYNLNSMVNKIVAKSDGEDHVLSGAFKKLFPIDTIYKPFRPLSPGIKYLIYTVGNTDTPTGSFAKPQSIDIGTKPRLYYAGPSTYYKYWVAPKNKPINISLEYYDDDIENPVIVKNISTNKIVARFETSHDTPTAWTITITKSDNTTVSKSGTSLNSNGEAVIYYNGTEWSLTPPEVYSTTESIKKVSLSATNSGSGKFLAVLELSPKWIKDLSDDVKSFDITKETGADNASLLPVGTLTANSLSISINKFRQGFMDLAEYDKSKEIDPSKTYLFKNSIIKPYIKLIDGDSSYKVEQGMFYILSWSISEFGEAEILALDSAKILQETLCPEKLIQDSPVTSIIRTLLDSIGFSNYKINVKKDSDDKVIDESIAVVKYWWSDPGKTVWEALQELCRDIQMNAFVDENNILNFYSRDYIYDSSNATVMDLTSEPLLDGNNTTLPNIINLSLQEIPSVNEVKILWSAPQSSQYDGGSSPLWKSDESWLGAGSLSLPLADAEPNSPNDYFNLSDNTLSPNQNIRSLFSYSGYVLIDNEIIEYDGIEYQYVPLDSENNTPIPVLIKSASDISKYRALSKAGYSNLNDPNSAYFKPTGRYKIKTRGALQTKRANHPATPSSFIGTDPGQFALHSMTLSTPLDGKEKPGSGNFKVPTSPSSRTVSKSFLSLSNLDKDKTTFTLAKKSFSSIDTSAKYFAFGTRMYFDSQFESPEQVGGIGIFNGSGQSGTDGYYIVIHTTASAKMKKDLRIIKQQKINNKNRVSVLKDSQNTSLNTLAGIYAGQAYNIDVLVKKMPADNKNEIIVFVNGFKISTFDTEAEIANITYPELPALSNISLLCGQGIAYFEYVYGKDIKESEYNDIKNTSSYMYNGLYSDDTLSMMYGDLMYNLGDKTIQTEAGLIEFGTTAREIRNSKVKYSDAPAIPIAFSTSKNRYATMLSSRIQPFGAETFVLNNTSTYIPLDDGNYSSFYVLGNSIYKSGVIEYNTYTDTDNKNIEPAIFQSNWIQTEEDAKNLGLWIKSTVLNKNKYINLEVFGNPLIAPGDIVSINYPLQGLTKENGKYIVVRSNISYSEGIRTQIVCRAI